ncbi:MAG: phage shock protein PspA [Gammaproteobacteria bacterium]|nr:phage shock protein PspA [Gammaproteobacteria bacterium]
MGIFNRLNDIINSNINSLLDSAENPEKIIRLVIQEMEDTLIELRTNAARTIAEQKKLNRRLGQLQEEAADWEAKAELALSRDREDLARAALAEKRAVTDAVAGFSADLESLDAHLAQLDEDMSRLQTKLDEAKLRQKSVVARHDAVSSRLKARVTLSDDRINDALAKFEHLERKMDDMEGKAESYDIGKSRTLRDEFAELEASDKVDEDLQALKKKMKK